MFVNRRIANAARNWYLPGYRKVMKSKLSARELAFVEAIASRLADITNARIEALS